MSNINLIIIIFCFILLSGCSNPNSGGSDPPDNTPPPKKGGLEINHSSSPIIVWNGNGYGVAWKKLTNDTKDILFTQIDTTGNKDENYSKIISMNIPEKEIDIGVPSMAWNNNDCEYGIVWQNGNYSLYLTQINKDGEKVGDVMITNGTGYSMFPSITWNENNEEYGIVWCYGESPISLDIFFVRINNVGEKISSVLRITEDPENSASPSLVWNGNKKEYAITWASAEGSNSEIYFQRINENGEKKGTSVKISSDIESPRDSSPSLVCNGGGYGLVWRRLIENLHSEIYFAGISEDEDDENTLKINNDIKITNTNNGSKFNPSLIWNGNEYSIIWIDSRNEQQVYFAAMNENVKQNDAIDNIQITDSSVNNSPPSLTWNGSSYGVVWSDVRSGNNGEIYFQQIGKTGTKIGSDVKISQ